MSTMTPNGLISREDSLCTHLAYALDDRITARVYANGAPMEVVIELKGDPIVLHIVTGEPERKFLWLADLLRKYVHDR